MNHRKLLVAGIVATVAVSSIALASGRAFREPMAGDPGRAAPSFGIVQAIALAQTYTDGVAIDAHSHRASPEKALVGEPRTRVYDVLVAKPNGTQEVRIDGRTGELVAAHQRARDGHDD